MSTVYVVVRTIGEKTLEECIKRLEKFNYNFEILENVKPLEKASKRTIQIGIEKQNEYDWVLALDADVFLELSIKELNEYCAGMKELYEDNLFCFTGFLNCTKRGIIDGLHFFRTKYCNQVYNYVKDKDFSFHLGREEYEICQTAKNDLGFKVVVGEWRIPFGTHNFDAQIKE